MEEATPLDTPQHDPTDDASPRPVGFLARPEQTMLPLDDVTTPEHDQPIGFALTVRARRAVAPGSLPALRVVSDERNAPARPDSGALEEPDDTRPARARALRRAGVPVSAISAQLAADPLTVTAWIGEIAPSSRRQGTPPVADDTGLADAPAVGGASPSTSPATCHRDEDEVAAHLARAAAAAQARERLQLDPPFAVAAGLLAATAAADRHAVTITTTDPRQASRVLAALRDEVPESSALARVILRLGPSVAADLTRHRVATQLDLAPTQISWTRWKAAPHPDAVQLLVRIAEPALASTVAGWIDAVLDPSPAPVDLAF